MCVPAARLSAALGARRTVSLHPKVGDGRPESANRGPVAADHPDASGAGLPDDRAAMRNRVVAGWRDQQHIADVSVAAANQDVRYYLNAVHIDRKPSRTIVEASDGHRVSQATSDGGLALEVLVPRDAFKSIAACNWTEIGMARDKLSCAVLGWR